MYYLLTISALIIGFFIGRISKRFKATFHEPQKDLDVPNEDTQFVSPTLPQETFEKAKTIDEFINNIIT